MKNRYGGPLAEPIAKHFHLSVYVDMVNTPAFHSDVIAYPAITVIGREKGGATRVAIRPAINNATMATLSKKSAVPPPFVGRKQCSRIVGRDRAADQPWILDSDAGGTLVRRLEAGFRR